MKKDTNNPLRQWDVGYVFRDQTGSMVRSKNPYKIYESSSTIKLPLMKAFMEHLTHQKLPLDTKFEIRARYKSNGSGIASWTDWTELPAYAIIDLTCIYSDCLTTNIMIDILGGKRSVNKLFADFGYSRTVLLKELLNFQDLSTVTNKVGTTTPAEASKWMPDTIDSSLIHEDIRGQFVHSTKNIDTPWFVHPKAHVINLLIKTGSMIEIDEKGLSVFNVVGSYEKNSTRYSFAFFSKGNLNDKDTHLTQDRAKELLTEIIIEQMI